MNRLICWFAYDHIWHSTQYDRGVYYLRCERCGTEKTKVVKGRKSQPSEDV